jgi:hypothetical protein
MLLVMTFISTFSVEYDVIPAAPATAYSAVFQHELPQSVPTSPASSALPRPLSNVARSDLVDVLGTPLYVRTYQDTPRNLPIIARPTAPGLPHQVLVRPVPALDPRPSVRFEEVLARTTSTLP